MESYLGFEFSHHRLTSEMLCTGTTASWLRTENLPGLEHNEHDNVGMPCEQDIMHCVYGADPHPSQLNLELLFSLHDGG